MKISDLIASYRTDAASSYGKLRQMTRNELKAEARELERQGTLDNTAIASWCRIFADNKRMIASGVPATIERGEAMLRKNWDRFERDVLDPALGERLRAGTREAV